MVQNIFEEGIFKLRELGVDDVVVPFILIFAVVYAIFSKIKIWGENKEKKYQGAKFDVVIALVVSLLAVWQHMANPGSQWDIVEMLNKALPQVSLVLVAAVMMILMIGIVAGEAPTVSGATKVMAYIVQFGAVAALVYIFGSSAGLSYWDLPYWLVSYDIWVLIVVLLVFGLI
ncbi:MAG TPA: hypothetical protein VK158_04625, partial [Acidobacteriota bacterium]|nr:hypothetical protein [Acidobacteriota bacterium]